MNNDKPAFRNGDTFGKLSRKATRCANANAELQEFIDSRPDARELRKALAVKLVYQGYKYQEIQTILAESLQCWEF
ncbi:MAG: hypothetical protein V7K89_00065 [Nostoc sp.]|uniref:hypothetical protein n=1 Tax=Nostoc sp. TaxID=1180 RepID=UPI002FFAE896